jgi:hypothetical protein
VIESHPLGIAQVYEPACFTSTTHDKKVHPVEKESNVHSNGVTAVALRAGTGNV